MILCMIQARMGSTRLPGKVLMDIGGMTMLDRVISQVMQCKTIDKIRIATTMEKEDDILAERYNAFRYHEPRDVLSRYYYGSPDADHVVRITSDCPFIIPEVVDEVVRLHLKQGNDFTHSERQLDGWPNGTGGEIMTRQALQRACHETLSQVEREHVTMHFYTNPDQYKIGFYHCNDMELPKIKYSVDTKADLILARCLVKGGLFNV